MKRRDVLKGLIATPLLSPLSLAYGQPDFASTEASELYRDFKRYFNREPKEVFPVNYEGGIKVCLYSMQPDGRFIYGSGVTSKGTYSPEQAEGIIKEIRRRYVDGDRGR